MPLLPPLILKPRRKRKRPAKLPSAGAVPVAEVTVVAAQAVGEFFVDFSFSEPVTCDGSGNGQVVVVALDGQPASPDASSQVNPQRVRFEFSSGNLAPGVTWSIAAPPDGLDFHGRTCAAPQAGTVE